MSFYISIVTSKSAFSDESWRLKSHFQLECYSDESFYLLYEGRKSSTCGTCPVSGWGRVSTDQYSVEPISFRLRRRTTGIAMGFIILTSAMFLLTAHRQVTVHLTMDLHHVLPKQRIQPLRRLRVWMSIGLFPFLLQMLLATGMVERRSSVVGPRPDANVLKGAPDVGLRSQTTRESILMIGDMTFQILLPKVGQHPSNILLRASKSCSHGIEYEKRYSYTPSPKRVEQPSTCTANVTRHLHRWSSTTSCGNLIPKFHTLQIPTCSLQLSSDLQRQRGPTIEFKPDQTRFRILRGPTCHQWTT